MRSKEQARFEHLEAKLSEYSRNHVRLRGISRKAERQTFVRQLLDSIRRVEYVARIQQRDVSDSRRDPASEMFDPLRASILFSREGDLDEAFWMVFLYTHFSKNQSTGWLLGREVYGGLGGKTWTWAEISTKAKQFDSWLDRNQPMFTGKFGNHRKYESLKRSSTHGTGAVVKSYVNWIGPSKSHDILIQKAADESDGSPTGMFAWLMNDMKKVLRFGRLARFDHLTMIGKLGLAEISPGSPFLIGATGPLSGAKLLFYGTADSKANTTKELDAQVVQLGNYLGVGMQEMEDSICNWQKSPDSYQLFQG